MLLKKGRLGGFGHFIPGAQASGAQVKAFWLTIDYDFGRVDIGYPAAVGMPLGMADIMTELRRFSA